MAFIDIKDLSFTYPEAKSPALSHVDLSIGEGEFVLVAGPSGCGKSTLLKHLKPSLAPFGTVSGSVKFMGRPVDELDLRRESREIGFVMQDPEMQIVTDKVWHELAFGLESLGTGVTEMRVRIAETANFFGIGKWMESDCASLSGGQKQLLLLAAVTAMQPRLLLLDEPTSQLDPVAASEFFDTLRRINQELGTTVIVTEHRTEGLFPIADRVVFMREGGVVFSGTPREAASLIEKDPSFTAVLPAAMTVFARTRGQEPLSSSPLTVREGMQYLKARLGGESLSIPSPAPQKHEKKQPVIAMRGAWFRYSKNGADILKGTDLDVLPGELLAVIGGNGEGKTTALMAASGMYKPYRGKVLLNGKPISSVPEGERYGKTIGVLLQNPLLGFTRDSIREELEAVRKRFRLSEERVAEVVELMELSPILDSNPYDVSGGEVQRAAIAKLLLPAPSVLFLDEATKGMDAFFKLRFGALLRKLTALGTAIVLVSHDIEFCAEYADRVAMFALGGVIAEGSPRTVLGGNSFYTTAAARIARGSIENALTAEDIVSLIEKKA
ncbi:MAG: ATP-binding cassette domain-containing protein [Clostridia bacterium]|nr:ATP-binding cassette domain-containing protein [Clostridia bacterium]